MPMLSALYPQWRGEDVPIHRLCLDSRQAGPDSLFLARRGQAVDGHDFVQMALTRGAPLAIVEYIPSDLPSDFRTRCLQVASTEAELQPLCRAIYGPSEEGLRFIGFTGTDGKTTMAYLSCFLLNQVKEKAGFIGTPGVLFPGQALEATGLTTPLPPELHDLLLRLKGAGCQTVTLEASSHAAVQQRLAGIDFSVLTLSHLAVDHLDYHQTVENYAAAKLSFFQHLPPTATAVLPADDLLGYEAATLTPAQKVFYHLVRSPEEEAQRLQRKKEALGPQWTAYYENLEKKFPPDRRQALLQSIPLWEAQDLQRTQRGMDFCLKSPDGETQLVHSPLYGEYNVQNLLAVLASLTALHPDIPIQSCLEALHDFPGVPGRMERVDVGQSYQVLVDFAHTPGAMEALLSELRHHLPEGGRLWTLCNSCGDRDREKRPLIAAICARWADEVILTLEEVGKEDPLQILDEVEAGFPEGFAYQRIPLRQEAIRRAVSSLQAEDILVLPSLGDESLYALGGRNFPYSDRDFAQSCLIERQMLEQLLRQSPPHTHKEDFL